MSTFQIHHITKYQYNRPARESINEIKIFPYAGNDQSVISQEITVTTQPEIAYYTDYWGNKTGLFNVLELHNELVIESRLIVKVEVTSLPPLLFEVNMEQLREEMKNNLRLLELSVTDSIERQEEINSIAQEIQAGNESVSVIAERCAEFIFHHFTYIKGITDIETTVDEILEHKGGVCQDFAHLMLHILATLKIPSRYVSGYICPNKSGMRGEGATHAWVEVYIPGHGWTGIDPTNNVWVSDSHIKLAVGRHFKDCTPVKGTFKGTASQQLSVYVSVGYEDGHVFEEVNNVKMHTTQSGNQQEAPEVHPPGHHQQ